ncbi:hypothetical protein [Jeotgalibacillus haloalkalitolerans]|uniref:Plasmid segregation centromere-binding protein ParR n=1 Tax=Jeotgalibacillus haloalkalitolerans TaxID=3104292 RepID=A0ABU5KJJ3_9BACL|nr:hypothetical protein [Jeotgalibacillus sp. HH7-29]MDZ5710895.1 hypothetical protein [Jeotgalibacillus sp. HH7-29]
MSGTIKKGQAITFRLPSDTPDHLLRELQRLKEAEKRNFSSKIAEFALEGLGKNSQKERETITVPIPKQLSKEQRAWLRHAHSEALLGNIVYQLLNDPVRATAILASMNSTSLSVDEALYLQEEEQPEGAPQPAPPVQQDPEFDDLDSIDSIEIEREEVQEEKEEDLDDLLGSFLDKMNK